MNVSEATDQTADPFAGLPEIARQLDGYGARFTCFDKDKLPRRPNGAMASVDNPASWTTLAEALAVVGTVQNGVALVGVSFVLSAEHDLALGLPQVIFDDLDGCLDDQGRPNADAAKFIDEHKSYTEISIGGRGLHVLEVADPAPLITRCVGALPGGQKIECYRSGRHCALTFNVLDGCTDELVDQTEAVERLAHLLNRGTGEKHPGMEQVAPTGVVADAELIERVESDPAMARRWHNQDGLTDRSSYDFRLGEDLIEAGYGLEDAEAILRASDHGQIGSGLIAGKPASAAAINRQVARVLGKAVVNKRHLQDGDLTGIRMRDGNVVWIDFVAIGENGRRRRAEKEAAAMDVGARPKPKTEPQPFAFWRIADMRLLEPPRFVVGGTVPHAAPSLIFAPSGAFKTTLSVDLVLSIAYRPDWHGESIPEPFPVIYVANEDRYALARQRIVGWADRYGIEDEQVIVLREDVLLHGADVVDRLLTTAQAAFPWAERCGFVFDTSDKSIKGDPDKASDVLPAMRLLDKLAEESAYVLSAAHTSWGNEERVKGSITSWNSYHMRGRLTKDPGSNTGILKIIHIKNGPSGQEFNFEYNQHDFDGISTMIPRRIEPANVDMAAISANAMAKLHQNQADAITALHRAIEAGPVVVPGWTGDKDLREFEPVGATMMNWRDQFREIATKRPEKPIKTTHVASRLEETAKALTKLGLVRCVANVWITRIKPQDITGPGLGGGE